MSRRVQRASEAFKQGLVYNTDGELVAMHLSDRNYKPGDKAPAIKPTKNEVRFGKVRNQLIEGDTGDEPIKVKKLALVIWKQQKAEMPNADKITHHDGRANYLAGRKRIADRRRMRDLARLLGQDVVYQQEQIADRQSMSAKLSAHPGDPVAIKGGSSFGKSEHLLEVKASSKDEVPSVQKYLNGAAKPLTV